MKKLLALICFLALACTSSWGWNNMIWGGQTPAGGSACSGDYGKLDTDKTTTAQSEYRGHLNKWTATCSGTLETISGYLQDVHNAGNEVIFAVYDESGGEPDAILYEGSNIYNAATDGAWAWVVDTGPSLAITQGNIYFYGYVMETTGSDFMYEADTGVGRYHSLGSFDFPANWDDVGDSDSTALRTIKLTF